MAFRGVVDVPPGGGEVVALEWDPLGQGTFRDVPPTKDVWSSTHRFSESGVYFPVLRATTHRQGDPAAPIARVQNLSRVRVVVQ